MRKSNRNVIINIVIVSIVSAGLVTAFSMSFGIIPALGDVLFPGSGVWNIPGDVPEYEEIEIPALGDDVTVIRDPWGVPHIYAENEGDLSFALGYVHAQDRLFQMDMGRRQVQGRLSEVLGDFVLGTDKFNLAMGMKYWSEKTVEYAQELQDNGTIDFFDDWLKYADGVNYYINTNKHALPLEYHLLGFEPEPWTVVDSMSYTAFMSSMLALQFSDLDTYVDYWEYVDAGVEEWYEEIYNPDNPYQVPVVPGYGDFVSPSYTPQSIPQPKPDMHVSDQLSEFLSTIDSLPLQEDMASWESEGLIGSNNWVVNGSLSNTGYPILCNDMHLAWGVPHIWYEAHLVCESTGLNTYGFTISGVPLPIVGHNEYVGWGMTNSGIDVMDWYYYEEIDEDYYIYNNTVTEFTYVDYEIKVKGGAPVQFRVRETVHGPVMNDFGQSDGSSTLTHTGADIIATQSTLYNITDTWQAIYRFNHATNITEFDDASRFFHIPGQNIVYGDVHGNIQIRPTARTPIRDDSKIDSWHFGNGSMPYNGSNGEGDWIGYVPFDELPVSTNPAQKYLASANQKSVGPDYVSYHLQPRSYSDGYRARRINNILSAKTDGSVSVEFMKSTLTDVVPVPAEEFTPIIIAELSNYYGINKPAIVEDVYSVLNLWTDYEMDKDEIAPTIFRAWRDQITGVVFGDEANTYSIDSYPRLNVLEFLMKENSTSHWFDDVTTTPKIENLTDCIAISINQTIDFLIGVYGTDDPTLWRYGEVHKVTFNHLLSAAGIDALSVGPFEASGDRYTLNPSGFSLRSDGGRPSTGGASERLIVDFSNLNNSLSVIPGGQRGVYSSRHYSDQLTELFLVGEMHVQWFTNTPSNFPTQATESRLIFLGGGS